MMEPAGPCHQGYYCPGGAVSPVEIICPVGHYCPEDSAQPTPCPSGTMTNELANPNITYCELSPSEECFKIPVLADTLPLLFLSPPFIATCLFTLGAGVGDGRGLGVGFSVWSPLRVIVAISLGVSVSADSSFTALLVSDDR